MARILESPGRGADRLGPDRVSYAEQRIFSLSPLNTWVTAAALYVALIGAYALTALAAGRPWIDHTSQGLSLNAQAREALVLAFIVCAVLALQRYSHLKEREEAPILARILAPGVDWAPETYSPRRLRLMAALGAGLSLAASAFYLPKNASAAGMATFAWFTATSVLLSMLFFRGLELTRMGSRHTAEVVRTLQVDLLRVDLLYPWGRAAARTSLIWFTVSAATCLLFVGGGVTIYTAFLLLGCAGIGVWVFVGTLSMIHHRIRKAKAIALDDLRSEITTLKARLHQDPGAPAKLQSLLAYEARIAEAPEWPFDQTILVRLGASALILTVPWFGQAFAGLVVEHFGKVMH